MPTTVSGTATLGVGLDIEMETAVDGRPVVCLRGELDAHNADTLRAVLGEQLDQTPTLIVDMSGLSFIDSTGLGVLVGALRRARSLGGDISLVVTKPTIRKVLTMTGLDRTFEVVGNQPS
jgi:anti-sigma B factor antagonist